MQEAQQAKQGLHSAAATYRAHDGGLPVEHCKTKKRQEREPLQQTRLSTKQELLCSEGADHTGLPSLLTPTTAVGVSVI